DLDSAPPVVVDQAEDELAAHRVADDVPCELRDRGRDDGQVGRGEPALRCQLPSLLAGSDDVGVGIYRHSHFISDECELHAQGPSPCDQGMRGPLRGRATMSESESIDTRTPSAISANV